MRFSELLKPSMNRVRAVILSVLHSCESAVAAGASIWCALAANPHLARTVTAHSLSCWIVITVDMPCKPALCQPLGTLTTHCTTTTSQREPFSISVHAVHVVQLQQPVHQRFTLGKRLLINSNLCCMVVVRHTCSSRHKQTNNQPAVSTLVSSGHMW